MPSFLLLSSRSRFHLFWAIIRPTTVSNGIMIKGKKDQLDGFCRVDLRAACDLCSFSSPRGAADALLKCRHGPGQPFLRQHHNVKYLTLCFSRENRFGLFSLVERRITLKLPFSMPANVYNVSPSLSHHWARTSVYQTIIHVDWTRTGSFRSGESSTFRFFTKQELVKVLQRGSQLSVFPQINSTIVGLMLTIK